MKFGKEDRPEGLDLILPSTHPQTGRILEMEKAIGVEEIAVGCAKWNRKDLRNFYPGGTKDDLEYYSRQFNAIELNASFYRMFPESQFASWHARTREGFRFFPKVPRLISHIKRLKETERLTDDFVTNILPLKEKLGMVFMQLREDFGPKNLERLESFIHHWPVEIPLAIEFRHNDWFKDEMVAKQINELMIERHITHIITDTPGKRDMLHMRLTTPTAFIRFNATSAKIDERRINDWLQRLEEWIEKGLKRVYFFVHETQEEDEKLLSTYLIKKMNQRLKTDLQIPKTLN